MSMSRRSVSLWSVALLVLAVGWPAGATAQTNLQKAYEKEFAHLEAQKRALKKRLEKLDREMSQSVDQAERQRDQLQNQLMGLQQRGDELSSKLQTIRRESESSGRSGQVLRSTVKQAARTLEDYPFGIEAPGEEEKPAWGSLLPELFEKGARAIDRSRSLRVEEGAFFLPDGTKTDGRIARIGNVAAYGVADGDAGALAPAGKGRLKLWKKPTAQEARAIASGGMPDEMGIFLFESLDKGVEQKGQETWVDTINSGGVIAWVIVGLGLVGLLLVLARTVILGLAGLRTGRLIEEVSQRAARGDIEGALARCEEASGAASRVMQAALDHLDAAREDLEDHVTEAILRETPGIERFGAPILVFSAVAPLLGLLGTVTGMISTFDIITEFGTGDPRMLSGGISEALVTTQLGLIVAIPLLLIGNLLKGWAERLLGRIERGVLRVMNVARIDGPVGEAAEAAPDEEPESSDNVESVSDYLGAV